MNYCSNCGAPVVRRWIQSDARNRFVCVKCNTIHYQNPRVVVHSVVTWGEKILFCRRSQEPARGKWMVPSGFLECGETLERAAARETFEETGLSLDPAKLELCAIMNMPAIDQVVVSFRTAVDSEPTVTAGVECLEVAFMSPEEIRRDQLAWGEVMGEIPQRFFDEVRSRSHIFRLVTFDLNGRIETDMREYQLTRLRH